MRATASKVTVKQRDPWADLFSAAIAIKIKAPEGKGWMTAGDFRKHVKCGPAKAYRILGAAVVAGTVEKFNGSQIVKGRQCHQVWYRPITK